MSRDRLEGDETRVILVTGDDHRGLRDAVGHILARRSIALAPVFNDPTGADEVVRRLGADARAPSVVLRADLDSDPPPDSWNAPMRRAVYPAPGRSSWRKKTRRANSHGQRRS